MSDVAQEEPSDVTEAMEAAAAESGAPAIRLGVRALEGDSVSESESGSDEDSLEGDAGADERKAGGQEDVAAALGLVDEGAASGSATDTESEPDDDLHQKLDVEGREAFLNTYHPEARAHNFEEVRLRSMVKRNKDGHIIDEGHTTLPFLTRYELTRVLGLRAQQLDGGAQPLVPVPPEVLDGYAIAEAELAQKKIPFIIRRPLPGGDSEFWRLEDLELLRSPAELGMEEAKMGVGRVSRASTSSGSRS